MKIGVYAGSETAIGGVYTIREDLLGGLVEAVANGHHRLVVFAEQGSTWEQRRDLHANVQVVTVGRRGLRGLSSFGKKSVNRVLTQILQLPSLFEHESWIDRLLDRHQVHFFVNLGPDALSMRVPYLCTVFDLQHRYQPFMPEVSSNGYWERWEAKYRHILNRATFVVTGTVVGRDEIVNYYQVPPDRILMLPHPTPRFALEAPADSPAPDDGHADPFFLYPAQFWPHKNHVTLLEALAIVRHELGEKLSVVLVGSDQGNQSFVQSRARELNVADYVTFCGVVSRPRLIELYRRALALTYVSTCGPENLPPLEAFALGCPVIASDIPGAAEQLADAAMLYPATNAAALAKAMVRISQDVHLRQSLVERGRIRARKHSSAGFASGILAAIDSFEERRKCWGPGHTYKRQHLLSRLLSH